MKKAWKGHAGCANNIVYPEDMSYDPDAYPHPVIVIDASDFPEGYPEIDSEWLDGNRRVTVISQPLLDTLGIWRTAIQWKNSSALRYTDSLKPIPETAKGEVVGSITFGDEATSWGTDNAPIPHGTYDIIKRGDK